MTGAVWIERCQSAVLVRNSPHTAVMSFLVDAKSSRLHHMKWNDVAIRRPGPHCNLAGLFYYLPSW